MPDHFAALHALQDLLREQQAAGVESVYLTKPARRILRQGIRVAPSEVGSAQPPVKSTERSADAPVDVSRQEPEEIDPVSPASYEGGDPAEQIEDLRRRVCLDAGPLSLGTLHSTPVFSSGDLCADLMLVVEAPGARDEQEVLPVAGAEGRKLEQILTAMGLSRDAVYISNLCKFRPATERGMAHQGRKPTPEEMRACLPFVLAEIEIVRPKVIVALGNTAAEGLLRIDRASVARLRGRWHDLDGIPLMVTHHPSHLIRAESEPDGGMSKKRLYWEDMLLVMEGLELRVSSRQRAYFT